MKHQNILLLPDKASALVHLDFALVGGSLFDPAGKEGTASFMLSMMLRGTQKRKSKEFHEALDLLGAEIHLGKYKESLRIYGVVLAEKFDAFMDLLEEMILEPSFDEEELEKFRSQVRGALLDELSSDDDIADRRFQEYCLFGNDYGRITSGTLESIEKIKKSDLLEFHRARFTRSAFILGATGGFKSAQIKKRFKEFLLKVPNEKMQTKEFEAPEFKKGKYLVLVNKPDRSQSQVIIGAPGVSFTHKDYLPLTIANHVFGGGSFSARLMKEVREKRGWSYGAYSWYRSGRKALYFAMSSAPANKDTVPALELMIKLFQQYAKKGITKQEFEFAKRSLVNQNAFLQDTMRKRLDNMVTEAVLGLPKGFYDKYQSRLKRVTYVQLKAAIKKNVETSKLFVLILGTREHLEKDLLKLKGFSKIWVRPYDVTPLPLTDSDLLYSKAKVK